MISAVVDELKKVIEGFPTEDSLVVNSQQLLIDKGKFRPLSPLSGKTIAFIDGGQANILSAANFNLSFIRVCAVLFRDTQKISLQKRECYVLTTAGYEHNELWYSSKIFADTSPLISPEDLHLSAYHPLLSTGNRRTPLSVMANMARRFMELALAGQTAADYVVLDGALEATYPGEERYLVLLGPTAAALAKTSDWVTRNGNSPGVLLRNKYAGCWAYGLLEGDKKKIFLVKLHKNSKHIFRFETYSTQDALSALLPYCADPIFIGYPYGLIAADQQARISHEEQQSLELQFLLQNPQLKDYLYSKDAHRLLDGDCYTS